MNKVEIDVLSERAMVWFRAMLATSSKVCSEALNSLRFSRRRSKTTIVSCTENPIMVRRAVMKRESTSIWKREKKPRTKITSWIRAKMAEAPNFHGPIDFGTLRKAKAMYKTIIMRANSNATIAFCLSDVLINGPMVVKRVSLYSPN